MRTSPFLPGAIVLLDSLIGTLHASIADAQTRRGEDTAETIDVAKVVGGYPLVAFHQLFEISRNEADGLHVATKLDFALG